MKFATYQRAVQPSTINSGAAKVSGNSEAYGISKDTSATEAGRWKDALGEMAKTAVKIRDDEDAVAVMDARNKIMSSITNKLYNTEDGLFVTGVGENAKGLAGRTTQAVKESFDEVSDNLNARQKAALRGFYHDNIGNFRRQAESQEMNEFNKHQTSVYNTSIDNMANQAALNYKDEDSFVSTLSMFDQNTDAFASMRGLSGIETEKMRREGKTSIIGARIDSAINSGDYGTAENILKSHGKEMDLSAYHKYKQNVRSQQLGQEVMTAGKNIAGKYFNSETGYFDQAAAEAELEKIYQPGTKRTVGGVDIPKAFDVVRKESGLIGQRMPAGANGCVQAALKVTSYFNPKAAEMSKRDVSNCPDMVQEFKENGIPVVEFSPDKVEAGDLIIYDKPSDRYDPDIPGSGNIHVVVSTGGTGYIGNSSSRLQIVESGDYNEINSNGMYPARIVKLSNTGGEEHVTTFEEYEKIKRAVIAAGSDLHNAWQADYKNKRDSIINSAYEAALKGDTVSALNIIDNSGLKAEDKYTLRSHFTPKSTGGGRSSGGRSGDTTAKQIQNALDLMDEYNRRIQDPHDHISAKDQTRYNRAARLLYPDGETNLASQDVLSSVRDLKMAGYSEDEVAEKVVSRGGTKEQAKFYYRYEDYEGRR